MKTRPLSSFTVDKREEYKLIAEELSEYYGKKLYWIPFKYDVRKIKSAFLELKKAGDPELKHLLQKAR